MPEKDWRYYAGPHASKAITNLGDLARALAGTVGPQADVVGMYEDVGQIVPSLKRGDYGQAMGSALMAGAAVPMMALPGTVSQVKGGAKQMENVFRGEWTGNKGGNFYTPDKEWARQFTQSGLDKEISKARIATDDILEATNVYAGDPDAVDVVIEAAKKAGKRAVRLNEGVGEPHSLYVFDKTALNQ